MVRFESKKRLEGLSWSQMAAAVCEKAAVAFPIFIDPMHCIRLLASVNSSKIGLVRKKTEKIVGVGGVFQPLSTKDVCIPHFQAF
jgi:hypothetical protein